MTPKPWRIQDRYSDFAIWGPTVKIGHTETHTPLICVLQQRGDGENQRSDANLIAAAPDLYHSAKALLAILSEPQGAGDIPLVTKAALDLAGAVNKAEGGGAHIVHSIQCSGCPACALDNDAILTDSTGMTEDERKWIG